MSRYWKTIGAAFVWLTGVVQAFVTSPELHDAIVDGNLTTQELLLLLLGLGGVVFTYQKKNLPPVGQAPDPNVSEARRDG